MCDTKYFSSLDVVNISTGRENIDDKMIGYTANSQTSLSKYCMLFKNEYCQSEYKYLMLVILPDLDFCKSPELCQNNIIYILGENCPFVYSNDDYTNDYKMTNYKLRCVKHAQHMLTSNHVILTQSNNIFLPM